MRQAIINIIKTGLNKLGYELVSSGQDTNPPQLTSIEEVLFQNNIGCPSVYLCPTEDFRLPNGLSFSPTGWNPFETLAREHMNSPKKLSYEGSSLERFYSVWQPANAMEALIYKSNSDGILNILPAYTYHTPWSDISPEERHLLMENIIKKENQAANVSNLGANQGYGLHGPVSTQKGKVEFDRTIRLLESIYNKGYKPMKLNDNITGIAIKRKDKYLICVAHGIHRVSVLSALNFSHIPVVITKFIDMDDISHWPQVYKKNWFEEEAAIYIEHLFEFDSLKWAKMLELPIYH